MPRRKRGIIYFIVLSITLMTSFISTASSQKYKDVPADHWANKAIELMSSKEVIAGYPDNTFKPDNSISRAEFARMMVVALNIPSKATSKASFIDVPASSWAFNFVESAKYYLTGFRTPEGDYFRPDRPAAREDMAVAIVKALGMENESVDVSILNKFSDSAAISLNLKKYVAIAIKNEIMNGSKENGALIFNPQKPITRAEAAVLLSNVIQEEKVTYDKSTESEDIKPEDVKDEENKGNEDYTEQEETPIQSPAYIKPKVSGNVSGSKIILKWNRIDDERLQGYKVVISKNNSAPKYPDDGYLYWITDKNTTSAVIDNRTAYNNGDFGQFLTSGQGYYFSVTAYYSDKKVPGNAVYLKYPGASNSDTSSGYTKPKVSGSIDGSSIILRWNKINDERLQGYKVVISKNNSAPKYPDDGYLFWITDKSRTSAVVDNSSKYNGGDFGGYLSRGEKYYFSITAVYSDKKVSGNVIRLEFPE